jgi:hypothetical protein
MSRNIYFEKRNYNKTAKLILNMKIVYIAHPISGDISGNLKKILDIIRQINLNEPETLPFAHYVVDCYALNDTVPQERERGIKNDIALLSASFINEIWLFGDRISNGMKHEIELSKKLGIPIISKSKGTKDF